MPSLLVIGECMMELKAKGEHEFSREFAGDTYNSAVYAKRWSPNLDVSILSAVGTDPISDAMLERWSTEGIDYSLVPRSEHLHPGIYAITTDKNGERNFIYWRQNSAASQMMPLLESSKGLADIPISSCVYFSGLSLAILNDKDKKSLLKLIAKLRSQGAKIAFDPNYRPRMWRDLEHAKEWINKAYSTCDIAFPGMDDHQALFSHQGHHAIHNFLHQFSCTEVIIKCGAFGVFTYHKRRACSHHPFKAAPNQIDSTAAGDSFAGTYLASRLSGSAIPEAVDNAAMVASVVVQHPGAIIDREIYKEIIFSETL